MSKLTNKDALEAYINDLILHRQDHENDEPLEVVGALIYAIQTREHFNEEFSYYLKNVSYTEKKQIKSIIKYNSEPPSPPLTQAQEDLFVKLLFSMPDDKVAKQNETRRAQEQVVKTQNDTEFLQNASNDLGTLKRKVGEELKKKVVDNNKVQEYVRKIKALQNRVEELTLNQNISIAKNAQQVVGSVLDNPEQTQAKLDYLQQLQITQDITSDELNKIQNKIANNAYAYNHIDAVREKTKDVLQQIRVIREKNLSPDKAMSILETLKLHKAWDDGARYQNATFGILEPEYIPEGFYVMHGKMEGEKSDIKMHVSVDSKQASIAMDIISEMAQSEEFANLVHEFKIGDIEHIQNRNLANTQIAHDKLKHLFATISSNPEIDTEKLLNDLIQNPDKLAVIRNAQDTVTQDKKALIAETLNDLMINNIGAIISGERILNEALFTVYFKKDMSKDDLKNFCDELNKRLKQNKIENGKTAQTDVSVNPYCGITIDHIVENNKKVYLQGSNPEHVQKRRQALRENPLTKEIIPEEVVLPPKDLPPLIHVGQLRNMAMHEDPKDHNGMSAFTVQGLSQIPLAKRAEFAGLLVLEKFKQTKNVNLVYRNPDMFTKWIVKDVLNELEFPVKTDEKVALFKLVEKATGNPPDEGAQAQLKKYFTNPKPEIVQMLLPFYHEYLEDVKKDFEANYVKNDKLPKDEQRNAYYQAREERLKDAKKQFLGHVSFPFVESLVFELQEKDDFSPERKGRLAQGFRTLREAGMMDDITRSLDAHNQGYIPPKADAQIINTAFQVYQKGKADYMNVQKEHRQAMVPIEQRSLALYKLVNRIASSYPKGSEFKEMFERFAGSIENIKTELDHKLLRGEKITEEDVNQVQQLFDNIIISVKQAVNTTNERNESHLHEAIRNGNKGLVEILLKAGADPRKQTSHYARGAWRALQDAFGQKEGGFFKNLSNSPSRTATELAKVLHNTEIHQLLLDKENELNIKDKEFDENLKTDLTKHDDSLIEENFAPHPTMVSGLHPIKVNEKQVKETSPFVAGWMRLIDEELRNLGDGQVTSDKNNIAIYALKRIRNLIESNKDIAPPELAKLNGVIMSINHETNSLPKRVKEIMDHMSEGKIVPSVRPMPERITGPSSEFVKAWDEHLSKMIAQRTVPEYFLKSIKDFLAVNPAMTADKLDGLHGVLDRLEKEAGNKNPQLKQVTDFLRQGRLPNETQKLKV